MHASINIWTSGSSYTKKVRGFFSDALINVVGDERLITGVNGTAGIFATYPTVGISTVNYSY